MRAGSYRVPVEVMHGRPLTITLTQRKRSSGLHRLHQARLGKKLLLLRSQPPKRCAGLVAECHPVLNHVRCGHGGPAHSQDSRAIKAPVACVCDRACWDRCPGCGRRLRGWDSARARAGCARSRAVPG